MTINICSTIPNVGSERLVDDALAIPFKETDVGEGKSLAARGFWPLVSQDTTLLPTFPWSLKGQSTV